MKAQIVEQVELFSEAELESLEFLPEELEAIEAERVPDLDSIAFEDIAEDLEAYFEGNIEEKILLGHRVRGDLGIASLERRGGRRRQHRNPPPIRPNRVSDANYNTARQILIDAGSRSARAAHPRHGNRQGNPIGFGLQLLREARNEFANNPQGLQARHRDAIHSAANVMGLHAQHGRAVW